MTTFNVFLRVLNFVLMIGIPVFLAMKIYRLGKSGFRPIWIGAVVFVLSQVGHIPFNQFLMVPFLEARGISPASGDGIPLIVFGLAVGLSAGIFEEVARYFALRLWLKKDHQEILPVKYGAGHGGVEALLLGLLGLVAFVQVLVLGGEGALTGFEPEQAALIQSQLEIYWAVPWQHSLLGAWERISAMAFHIGASIMVYKSIVEKKPAWLVIALLGHTVLDALAVIGVSKMDLVLLESVIFVFALVWLRWSWMVRAKDPDDIEIIEESLPEQGYRAPQITAEQIEESRYDE